MKPSSPDVQIVLALYEGWAVASSISSPGTSRSRSTIRNRGVCAAWSGRARGASDLLLQRSRVHRLRLRDKAILADPRVDTRPNDDLVAQWLLTGWSRSNRERRSSAMSSPSRLRTSSSITPDGASKRRYWDFDTDAEIRLRDFGGVRGGVHERFETAVTRRNASAHPVAISLSGGLDSSSIASFAALARDRNGGTPEVLAVSSFGPEGSASDERAFTGPSRTRWSIGARTLRDGSRRLVGHGSDITSAVESPLGTPVPNMVADLFAASRDDGARVMLAGHWGDQLVSDQTYYVDLARRFRWMKTVDGACSSAGGGHSTRIRWSRRGGSFEASRSASSLPMLRPFLRRFRTAASRPVRDAPWFTDALRGRSQPSMPSGPASCTLPLPITRERSTSRRDPHTRC